MISARALIAPCLLLAGCALEDTGPVDGEDGEALRDSAALIEPKAGGWTLERTIAGSSTGSFTGFSVAIDGDTAVVAERNRFLARVYVRSGTTWSEQAVLRTPDNDVVNAVAIDSNTAVLGAPYAGDGEIGAAYVFTRSGTVWTRQASLAGEAARDGFGVAVDVDGDRAVIGADMVGASDTGAAYVFRRSGATWASEAKLVPGGLTPSSHAGRAVAIDGDRVLLGAPMADNGPGAAFVYRRQNTWQQQAKLVDSQRAFGDDFGGAVALSGTTAVVGASLAFGNSAQKGAAVVFVSGAAGWSLQARLFVPGIVSFGYFGKAVAVDANTVVVGAPGFDGNVQSGGAAYAFTRTGTQWSAATKLRGGAAFNRVGTSVAVSGARAVVGANGVSQTTGAAYVYVH